MKNLNCFKRLKSFKEKLKINTFFKIYSMLAIPTFIVIIAMLTVNYIYTQRYRNSLEKNYINSMQSAYRENEKEIQSIISGINMLAYNEKFMSAMEDKNISLAQSSYLTDLLRIIEQQNDSVYNIMVIDREENIVNTSLGRSALNMYFLYKCNYKDYNEKYWMEYKAPLSGVQRLSPTVLRDSVNVSNVIPIVFTQIGKKRISQILVVNINITNLLDKMENCKFTDNSRFFIISNQNGTLFNRENIRTETIDKNLYNKIMRDKFYSSKFKWDNGGKSMIISATPSNSMLGYTYFVVIPYKDINRNLRGSVWLFVGIMIILIAGVFLLLYKNAKEINGIFSNIAAVFKNENPLDEEDDGLDVVEYIMSSINDTIHMQHKLENELVQVLPLAAEKYLLNLLNNNSFYVDDAMERIAKNFVDFKYDGFLVVIVKMEPTSLFYEEYSSEEHDRIRSGIYEIIKTIFSDLYCTYIIPSEDDTLTIILNIKDMEIIGKVDDVINNIALLFEIDKDYIKFVMGVGEAHRNIAGLKRSYKEAQSSILNKNINLCAKPKDNSENTEPFISSLDEDVLYNYLAENDYESAKSFIDKIFNEISQNDVSDFQASKIYVRIFSIINKVMGEKNVFHDNPKKTDFEMYAEIADCSENEAYEVIMDTIHNITEVRDMDSNTDIVPIIDYINENYCDVLSLDILADIFNMNPKYISKRIKEYMGITFVDYLANLRINRAKELLLNTDKTIYEIYMETGFNNRNTFVRTFKKCYGGKPSEYRDKMKK